MGEKSQKLSICGLCGGGCLIDATLEDGKITEVEKAKPRPHIRGDICVRGSALKQYVHHKDRLQYPMKRVGPKGSREFERISWDEAFSIIAGRLLKTREEFGAKSTVFYCGHPKWYRQVMADLAASFGTPNFCTESSTCRNAAQMAWMLDYGNSMPNDMKNSSTFVIWSRNQAYGAAGHARGLVEFKERGGKLIVVDPRVTPVANLADIHLQLLPGTDGALALGLAYIIIRDGLEDREFIEKYTYGYEAYRDYVNEFPPERVSEITGIPAEQLEQAAHMIAENGPCSFTSSNASVVHCINGVQNLRAAALLMALTGNVGKPGTLYSAPGDRAMLDSNPHNLVERPDIDDDISDRRFPAWNELIGNEANSIQLADNILDARPYPVKNLISLGMNVEMWPDSARIVEALKAVEFSVCVELFWNTACENADIVLPSAVSQERDQVVSLPGNWIRLVEHIIDPGDKRNDVEILIGMYKALGLNGKFTFLDSYDDYLNHVLKPTGVTLEELRQNPDGVPAKKLRHSEMDIDRGFDTPSGKIEFYSKVLEKYSDLPGHDPLPVYTDWRDVIGDREKYPLILSTGGRKPQLFHSRTYRMSWISGLEPHTLADMSPADAERLGIRDGDPVELSTPLGSLKLVASIDHGVREGEVFVFHDDPYANINRLIAGDYIDPISGFPGFKSYICSVKPLAGAEVQL